MFSHDSISSVDYITFLLFERYEITAAALTNPVSCHLMYEATVEDKHKAVVSTAACSRLLMTMNLTYT